MKVWYVLPNGIVPQNQQEWNALQTSVSNLLAATQDAFNQSDPMVGINHKIYFNYEIEYIVSPELETNVDGFFNGCESSLYDDPDRLDILLIQAPPTEGSLRGATGAASSEGGDKLFSITDATLIHELGHMFDLIHTHGDAYPCIDDIPTNWTPGMPYSKATTGDEVEDTPIHPVVNNTSTGGGAFDDVWVYTGCNINWNTTVDNCTPTGSFPPNYSSKIVGGTITYDNVLERNFMANVFPPGCNIPLSQQDFTLGQAERMRCHIDTEKQGFFDNGSTPDQFIDFASGCTTLSGVIDFDVVYDESCYVITSDLIIAGGNVSFIGTEVNVIGSSTIFVNEGSKLSIQGSNFQGSSSCSTWGGIISPGGADMIEISFSHIEECSLIDLDFVFDFNINNSLFDEVTDINLSNNTVTYTDMSNNAFIGSNINLTDQFMHFQGCKFSDCAIVVENTEGSDVVFERTDRYLPYFKNSNIHVVDAGNAVVDDSYFDNDCTNPIIIDKCIHAIICRSYFNNCNQQATGFGSFGGQNIFLGNIEVFDIFHNHFLNDDSANIYTASESGKTSLVQNNIFEGVSNYDIDTRNNTNVDISCNFHENTNIAWWTNELITQGNPAHAAGNVFESNQIGINNTGNIFTYYFNQLNSLELPIVNDPDLFNLQEVQGAGSVCLSRSLIARIWDFSELCFPSFWTNWPECQDIICEQCVLPPPTRVSDEAAGRVLPNDSDMFRSYVNFENQDVLEVRSILNNQAIITPNPLSDIISIKIDQSIEYFSISIYNIDGILINTTKGASQLDLSYLTKGMYIIVVKDSNNSILLNEKIIKI